jgi:cell division cycle 14
MTPAIKYGQIIEYIPGKLFSKPPPPEQLRDAMSIASRSASLYIATMDPMDYLSMVEWVASIPNNHEELGENDETNQRLIVQFTWLTYADRLYLASYTTPPTPDTLFPYPDQQPSRRSPSKRSARAVDGPSAVPQRDRNPPYYFSIDDTLLYNAFHHDFGPLHIGHLYRFAVQFHDILGAPENKDKPVVFWSKADARSE